MNKRVNLIIGSGVLGAYLSDELLKKKEKVVVTTRSLKKKYDNYKYLNIQKKVKFEKLDINKKAQINQIISKYKPKKIFYFAGQSSLAKSTKFKKQTFNSHYNGTKNFLEILKKEKLNTKFFKANSGYIFAPKNGLINLKCKFSTNKNPYIHTQQKVFDLIKKFRKFKLNLSNLVFMQIESPLRPDDFFIKKVCLGAKNKKKIIVGNMDTFRDYSWITDIAKAILLTSNLKTKDYVISAGSNLSGAKIIKEAYKLNGLNYKKYYSISKKFFRKDENKFLIGSKSNTSYLRNKYNFKFKFFGLKLIEEMYNNL
jgi:GDPmannose 4,6-dehydratase